MKGARELPPVRQVAWARTYRMIPGRYPPADLFERIADPAEWETLAAIEGLTNDRLRDQLGDISVVPRHERITGPGASPIMAAFTHTGFPSRFTDGSYGVYYASERLEGALREVVFHQERFLRRTAEGKTRLEMRTYIGSAHAPFRDVCQGWARVHDPDDYTAGQALGREARAGGSNGIVYRNVRLAGVANLAAFRPRALAARKPGRPHTVQGPHLYLLWDGTRIDRFLEVGQAEWQALPRQRGEQSRKSAE